MKPGLFSPVVHHPQGHHSKWLGEEYTIISLLASFLIYTVFPSVVQYI